MPVEDIPLLSARLLTGFEQPEVMQIFVRSSDRTFTVTVDESTTVQDLKASIEDIEFIPADYQRIVTGTATLASGLIFDQIQEDDTVTLLLAINGGMRAKWRKKRMRRLRRKRRKMRQRAR